MKRVLIIFCLLFVGLANTQAIPALRKPRTVIQPDGSTLTLTLRGDEFGHWYTDEKGIIYAKKSNGWYVPCSMWEYQNMQQRRLKAIQQRASAADRRAASAGRRAGNVQTPPAYGGGTSRHPSGNQRVLVLLAEANDVKFSQSNPKEAFDKHLNGVNYKGSGYGSARDYFIDQSNGIFTPTFDIYGPYAGSHSMSYYGKNDEDGNEKAGELVAEVLRKANKDINYKDFDSDNDGVVDFCYVIYAGYSESESDNENDIWPHQWDLGSSTGSAIRLDGVQINEYACGSELKGGSGKTIDGIGTICHEFSHCLGLPDFYDTNEERVNFGMSVWSVMDNGCYNEEGCTPCGYTAYEKEYLGWLDIETLDAEQAVTLRPTADGGKAYRIVNHANPDEYYIVENIQQKGWNRAAYGHGMLVTHVDYKSSAWKENAVNSGSTERMTIVPADGSKSSNYVDLRGDLFPGILENHELTDYSRPAAATNDGGFFSQPITDITEGEEGTISFNFMEGCSETTTALSASTINAYSFLARWEKRDGTKAYVLELFRIIGEIPQDKSQWNVTLLSDQGELIRTIHTEQNELCIDNLEGECLYCYRVRCLQDGSLSAPSNVIFALTTADDGALVTPELFRPEVIGDNSIRLSWTPVSGASYIVEYAPIGETYVKPTPDNRLIMAEKFDRVKEDCGEITRVLDLYTDTTDWSGSEVHAQDGCVLLGSDTDLGYLISPTLPFTEGYVTVEFAVRRYNKNDNEPIFHVCLQTDADTKNYVAQIGGKITDDEWKYYYCVLGPLDTGSKVSFLSNCEQGKGSKPRVRFDNLAIYWGDRSSFYGQSKHQPLFREGKAALPSSAAPMRISTSTKRYIQTETPEYTLTDLEAGCYACRVRAVRNGIYSPYSAPCTAVVGATTFETEGMNFEIISTDLKTVQLVPFSDGRLYEGDVVIPESISFAGTDYTVTALADSVFRGCTALTSVVVPSSVTFAGSKLFKGCERLAYVDWPCPAPIDATAFIGAGANALLFVNGNVEVGSSDVHVIRDGEIDRLTIYISSPFLNPRPFHAKHITYMKDFSQENIVGKASGWETIVLPFDVQRVSHNKFGTLTPYGTEGTKAHYWLGQFNGTAFEKAEAIQANVPYIIAFPNSADYKEETRINGAITFSADDVTVQPTTDVAPIVGTKFDFVPVYKKVYKEPNRYMLNVYDTSSTANPTGSTFLPSYMSLRTFGAYLLSHGRVQAPQQIPIQFVVEDDEDTPTNASPIYDVSGRLVRSASESRVQGTEGLEQGIYIIGNQKRLVP